MRRFYVYIILSRAFFLNGIWMLFLIKKGFSLLEVASLDVVFWSTLIIASVPGGMLTDHIGRKKSLIGASFFVSIAIIIFALSNSLMDILISYILWAAGSSITATAEQAWIYEEVKNHALLQRIPPRILFQDVYGRLQSVGILSLAVSTMIGGYFAQIFSLEIPILLTAIATIIAALWLLTISEKKYTVTKEHQLEKTRIQTHTLSRRQFKSAFRTFLRPQIFLFSIIYMFFLAALFTVSFYSQPWLDSLGLTFTAIGLIQGTTFLVMSGGSLISARISRFLGSYAVVIIIFITIFLFWGMTTSLSVIAVLFFLLLGVIRGLFIPLADSIVNELIPSSIRATVLSFIHAGQTLMLLSIEFLTAAVIEHFSFQVGFLVLSGIVAVFCGILSLLWLYMQKNFNFNATARHEDLLFRQEE